MIICHRSKFSSKVSAVQDVFGHILKIWSFTVALTLNTANQSVWKTIWLRMMHHNTKFGSKNFSNSEDTVWTNIHWQFETLLSPWYIVKNGGKLSGENAFVKLTCQSHSRVYNTRHRYQTASGGYRVRTAHVLERFDTMQKGEGV